MAKYKLTETGVFNTENGAHIPNDQRNRDWVEYLEWVGLGNTADPEFTLQERRDNRVLEIKDEAHDRIVAVIPEYLQRNKMARVIELLDKRDTGTLDAGELQEIEDNRSIWTPVAAIRVASDAAELAALASDNPESIVW